MSKFNSWTNLNLDGRRMDRIIKLCETMIRKETDKGDDKLDNDIILAYIDRLIKSTHQKERLTDLVLGISHLRKLAEAKLNQPKMMLR